MEHAKISRDEKQIQTRLNLINAGLHLISEQGYSAASIRNISKYAGYTQGAFYSNFSHKEEFLLTLMKSQFEQENAQLEKIMTQIDSDFSSLLEKLELWLTDFFQNDEWLKISIELQLYAAREESFAAEYQQVWQTHHEQIAKILIQLFSHNKQVDAEQLEAKILEIISLSYGLALQYMIFKDDLNKYIQIITQRLIGQI
ncbi:TetR/AcrR family transcriptional regulator [Acinetobacter sp. ANC 4639]